MKNIFLLFFIPCFVTAQGIDFQDFSLEKSKEASLSNHRLIFVDLCATWCAPCKKMEKEIFPQPEVGDYYNKKFICTRLDRDSDLGAQIAEQYKVAALPCYLFLDADGNLIFRAEGATSETQAFINFGKTAIDLWMSARWQRDLKNPRTLYHYALYMLEKGDSSAANYYQKYMDTQKAKDLQMPENLDFVVEFIKKNQPAALDFFWKNTEAFAKHKGKDFVYAVRWQALELEIKPFLPKEKTKDLDTASIEPLFARYFPENPRRFFLQYQLRYYQELMYFEKLRPIVFLFANEVALPTKNVADLQQAASMLYLIAESTDRQAQDYETALDWALLAAEQQPSVAVYNLLFDIYASLGMEKEAVQISNQIKLLKEKKTE